MFYSTFIKFLCAIFVSISASNLTVLYIAKTISNLQINLRFFKSINIELLIFVLCIFFMYFAVIFFHYNKHNIISKFKEYLNTNIFEKSLKQAIYLNNKYNSNIPSQDIVKNFSFLEKYLTKNIDRIFYLPWLFLYLFFLKELSKDIFIINMLFIILAVFVKFILYLKLKFKKSISSQLNFKTVPNINIFYNIILANLDIFKKFHLSLFPQEKSKDFFLYFLGFIKSANIIIILIYNSLHIKHNNIQNIIIIYILTNHIIFFLERILFFKLEYLKFKEVNKFFTKVNSNNEENFFSKQQETQMQNNIIISAQNLYFKYYDTEHFIIKNLSLNIFENKIHLIIGENNSGKSTLIKLLSGTLNFEKGILTKKPNKTICLCDDNIIFFERLNFLLNLTIFNDNPEIDKKLLDYFIKDLNFLEDIKHYPGILKANIKDQNRISSSIKKKTAIIRTLFSNKDILFFDINLYDFDDKFIENFKKILKFLNKTIIISSNSDKIFDIADIVYKLEKN